MNTILLAFSAPSGPDIFILLVLLSFVSVVVLLPWWQIFKKAGLPPALSLLMLVPLANLIMLFYVAFASWPALERRKSDSDPSPLP